MEQKKPSFWDRVKHWFINSGLYAIAGAILGIFGVYISSRGARADFDRLREDNEQLIRQVEQLRERLESITDINDSNKEQLIILGAELHKAQQYIDGERERISSGRIDVEGLERTNQKLRDWIQKYGERVKDI